MWCSLIFLVWYLYIYCLSEHKMPEGSWKCGKCNNINYPFRTKCNRQNCGADKPSDGDQSPSEPADENDQVCCQLCLLPMSFWFLKRPSNLLTTYVYVTFSIYIQVSCTSLVNDLSVGLLFFLPVTFVVWSCCGWIAFFSLLIAFSTCAFIDSQLCNVPVSSRTCFEKVQSCRPALLSMVKVSHVVFMLQQLLSFSAFLMMCVQCCIKPVRYCGFFFFEGPVLWPLWRCLFRCFIVSANFSC